MVCMKAWLFAEDFARPSPCPYQIVLDRLQAAAMSGNNARQVMRGAERDHPQYAWAMIKVSDGNVFLVEGTRKQEK
jgi:hypothetical protein